MSIQETILENLEFIFQDKELLEDINKQEGILYGKAKELVRDLLFSHLDINAIEPVAMDSILALYYDSDTDLITLEFTKNGETEVILSVTGKTPEDIMANMPKELKLKENK